MARELTCSKCRCQFPVSVRAGKKGVRCPLCATVCEQAEADDTEPVSKPSGPKCPGCKKVMARGVTYCPTCNVSLFDAWGDAEENAPAAGRRAEMAGYADLVGKTIRIFIYLVTLRWWKVPNEF